MNASSREDRLWELAFVMLVGAIIALGFRLFNGPSRPVQVESRTSRIALTAAGNFALHKEITVMAYVKHPEKGQSVSLRLPDGMVLVDQGESLEKELVPTPNCSFTKVCWQVKGTNNGTKMMEAELQTAEKPIASARYDVRICTRGCNFGEHFDE